MSKDLILLHEKIFRILNEDHNYYLQSSGLKTDDDAARVIQNAWKSYKNRRIYRFIRNRLVEFMYDDPVRMLRRVSMFEANFFEKKFGHCLVFRLAGLQFPPFIVYKIFTNCQRNIGDNEAKNVMKVPNRSAWDVFYVYKSIHERVRISRKRLHRPRKIHVASKRKNSGIEWIKTMY